MNRFDQALMQNGTLLTKTAVEVLQVNVGKYCNLACTHCHVEAGPTKKRENMNRETAELVTQFMDRFRVTTLDLTGGAPELNPHFRTLVTEAKLRALHVMDRCNLTVFDEPAMEDLPDFLAQNAVEVVASLPCYSKENVDQQRGKGAFEGSIRALLRLNELGYGKAGTKLKLSLVYNPVGAHLPPQQKTLESDYKQHLFEDFGISFNQLYCIANMPITRYAKFLRAHDQYEDYVQLLEHNFNHGTVRSLMCRNTLSVSWDGKLYDCDFNQALGLEIQNGRPLTIANVTERDLRNLKVLTADHCFGCTAGAGSSCQGALN